VGWARALDGSEYMPGLVGLNNMKQNDYANVVVQALIRVWPIRWVPEVAAGKLHAH
jgi:U4/U6.U5 tri-snRNP-associated protein 2